MVQNRSSDTTLPSSASTRPTSLFARFEPPAVSFPFQSVRIDWDRLIAKLPVFMDMIGGMLAYLLKPEVLALLDAEKYPRFRQILDLMWSTGARVSEALAITPSSFVEDGYDFGVIFKSAKTRLGATAQTVIATFT